MWYLWCTKNAFLWVQLLICLLSTWALSEDASLPYVDGGWQEQAGKAGGVLAPLLADNVSAFCRALTKNRMATHREHRFSGENISSCRCQWYQPSKRFIRRSLSIFQKWKLTCFEVEKRVRPIYLFREPQLPEGKVLDVVTKPNSFWGFSGI